MLDRINPVHQYTTVITVMNRDLNVAVNLEKLLNPVSFTEINACGQSGSANVNKVLAHYQKKITSKKNLNLL